MNNRELTSSSQESLSPELIKEMTKDPIKVIKIPFPMSLTLY